MNADLERKELNAKQTMRGEQPEKTEDFLPQMNADERRFGKKRIKCKTNHEGRTTAH